MLVLPLLPVIAIVLPLNLFLANFAILIKASLVLVTCNALNCFAASRSETMIPAAPLLSADLIKSCPSNLCPFNATNISPFLIV